MVTDRRRKVYVNFFEAAFASWVGVPALACIVGETCGYALVLEQNGDLYLYDHFVEPASLLCNILTTPMADLVASDKRHAHMKPSAARVATTSVPMAAEKSISIATRNRPAISI